MLRIWNNLRKPAILIINNIAAVQADAMGYACYLKMHESESGSDELPDIPDNLKNETDAN